MSDRFKLIRKPNNDPMNHITVHECGGVVYLTFPILEQLPGIVHGFSTRLGGVSQGDVGTMNLSFSRESSRQNVEENYRRLAKAIGYEPERLVCSRQTHTTNVRVVTEEDCGIGFCIPLMTFYADCVPLLLADPVHRAIGCAHSGWRGTAANMGKAALEVMKREYGTEAKDVITAIGPSICQDCYEVSEDVIDQFREVYHRKIWPDLFYEKQNGKFQLNLWEACRQNFLMAGVLPEHISLPDLCTCCNPKFLFSHRASRGNRGNLAAVVMLR